MEDAGGRCGDTTSGTAMKQQTDLPQPKLSKQIVKSVDLHTSEEGRGTADNIRNKRGCGPTCKQEETQIVKSVDLDTSEEGRGKADKKGTSVAAARLARHRHIAIRLEHRYDQSMMCKSRFSYSL